MSRSIAFGILYLIVSLQLTFSQEYGNRYELVKMDKEINTFRHEAAPVVSPDGNTLYFFVQNHPENTLGKDDTQDIWYSKKDETGKWSKAEHLRAPFNIHASNQVFTVFQDGSLFIRGGKSKGEKGFSIVSNGSLKEIDVKDFKVLNKGRFYGASMSEDRKHIILYFSEKDKSALSDLYISHLIADNKYTRPEKLALSTATDEVGPFISPDQKVLYFASGRNAPNKQGGVDIYRSERLDDTWTNWSEPINLGKPINTAALDFYFTIDRDGNIFTSRANKAVEGAQLDLYQLVPKKITIQLAGSVLNEKTLDPLPADVVIKLQDVDPIQLKANSKGEFATKIPEVTTYTIRATYEGFIPKEETHKIPTLNGDTTLSVHLQLKPVAKKLIVAGNVYDKKTDKLIEAKVDVKELKAKTGKSLSTRNGNYETEVEKTGWFKITASAEGYLNATDSVQLESEEFSPALRDLYLSPIEIGVTVILKNIYFDFDKTTLKRESYPELDKVVELLKQNPTVEVEIAGHTDDKGSDQYNENLSQGRSQAVVDYLISQGIATSRLRAKGYGESKPIDTNDTEAGRANNRRVEFTILKK
jgi:OOP family OmpA-OmpF porin